MFKFLFAVFLISCVSNQNSKISPEPQNLTENKVPEKKQYTPSEDTKIIPSIYIPTDTSKTKANNTTSIIIEKTDNEVKSTNTVETKKNEPKKTESKKKVDKPQSSPTTNKSSGPTGYSVQVAAFKEIGLAEQKKFKIDNTLKKSGIITDSYIVIKDSYYKILVGDYSDKKTAEVLKASLNSVNINGFIVK